MRRDGVVGFVGEDVGEFRSNELKSSSTFGVVPFGVVAFGVAAFGAAAFGTVPIRVLTVAWGLSVSLCSPWWPWTVST